MQSIYNLKWEIRPIRFVNFALTVFFLDFLATAFAFLSSRHIVTQLIVFSEPVDGDVTFGDVIIKGSKY